jgi:hypothetical protein
MTSNLWRLLEGGEGGKGRGEGGRGGGGEVKATQT